jgi:hypothetical protein
MDLTDVTKKMLNEMPSWESVKSVEADLPNETHEQEQEQPLRFRIRISDRFIVIEFNQPLTQFALNKEQALSLGQILNQRGAGLK